MGDQKDNDMPCKFEENPEFEYNHVYGQEQENLIQYSDNPKIY